MQEMNGTEHRELEYEYESWGEKQYAKVWIQIGAYESDGTSV